MDFSECYRCSLLPAHSPDGAFIAVAVEYRLVIREAESLKVVQIYSCLDKIHSVAWSPNSKYVLCGLFDRGVVQAWAVDDAEWACKVDEGPAGVKAARWSPDGLSVLLVADFAVRMTVWSLVDSKCTYLPGPKFAAKGWAFSPRADTLAVLERKECKDCLALYSTATWELRARVQVGTMDAADLAWSPDGSRITVWDGPLTHRVVIVDGEDGSSVGSYSAYDDALGIRCVSWSPGGDLLAVGSYDQVVHVLNNVTWQPLLECHHGSPVDEPADVAVYQEVEEVRALLAPPAQLQQQGARQGSKQREARARYTVCPLPADVTSVEPPANKPNPKLGIATLAWSADSRLLASVNENMPHGVWLWDVSRATLAAVLLHLAPVRSVAWAPSASGAGGGGATLAISTGCGRVYVWTAAGASIVHIPLPGFSAAVIAWGPDGSSMALMDREAFCCAYLTAG